jgi:cyclic pyranopterin phosphate synthase
LTATNHGAPSTIYHLGPQLYLNITNQCTNDCYFCLRKFKTGVSDFNLKLEREPTSSEVLEELQRKIHLKPWKEFIFCGFGEPTIRLDLLLEVADWIRKRALGPIRVDTNGHGLSVHPGRNVVEELKKAGVSRLSVSINAHNEAIYNDVCRPRLDNAFKKILEFVRQARDADLNVEFTAVTIPEISITDVAELASRMSVGFRVRPLLTCIW